MEKINKLKKNFKIEKIDGYIVPKMMSFLMNTFLITMIDLNIYLILRGLMASH